MLFAVLRQGHHEPGEDVEGGTRVAADHDAAADADELMDAGVSADDHAVLEDRMSTKHRALRKHDVVRQLAVVAGVGAVHEEVVIADLRGIGLMDRSVDGGMFAKDVAIPDQGSGAFLARIEVAGLRRDAEGAERPDVIVLTDDHGPLHEAMGSQLGSSADSNRPLKDAVRADFDVFGEFDSRVKNGCGVDPRHE